MQTVIGLFENAHEAQQAVQELMSKGFTNDNVDVSVRGNSNASSGSYASEDSTTSDTITGTSGSGSGSVYGDGDITGSPMNKSDDYNGNRNSDNVSDNGSGSIYDNGDQSTRRMNTSGDYGDNRNDDSFGDKVSRFFKNLFGDNDDDADRYSTVANKTGCVVTVHAQSDEEAERAADILDEYGAVDVNERAAAYGYSGKTSGSSSDRDSSDRTSFDRTGYDGANTDVNESDTLNVIKEDVQIGKREVETGGVRLRSRIVERPVEEQIRLREEKVTVERNPVDRAATSSDFQNFKEGDIEVTERAEVADVSKQARVIEEVKLNKEVNERTETISETARDTEVDVENLSKSDVSRKGKKKNL